MHAQSAGGPPDVVDAAAADRSLDSLLTELLERACSIVTADIAVVLLVEGDDVVPRKTRGLDQRLVAGLRIPIGSGFAGRVAATKRPMIVDDVATSEVINPALRAMGVHALLGVPILFEDGVIGVLHVGTLTSRRFDGEDAQVLQILADRIGLSIAYARLYEQEAGARAEAEREQRRSRFLANVTDLLSSTLEYDLTLKNLARLAVPELGDWCVVDMLRSDGKTTERVAVASVVPLHEAFVWEVDRRHPLSAGDPLGPAHVAYTGQPEIVSELTDEIVGGIAHNAEHVALIRELGMVSYMAVPLAARGRILGAISFATSVSGRRYAASDLAFAEDVVRRASLAIDNARLYHEAQEMSRLRHEFLATVSHELRTPLTPILAWSHLLRSRRLAPPAMERALDAIERAAKTQARLVEDLLDMSRIITGKLRLDVEPIQLATVVEPAIESMRPAAQARGITLRSAIDPAAGVVLGDPSRLQQVVWNLLSNAIKFTPEQGRVDVAVAREGSQVRVTVRDTGSGISPEFLARVFDPFSQADSSTTRLHGGLGLGLAIVRHVVELHGGVVRVENAEEGGAVFAVGIPLAAPADPAHEPTGGETTRTPQEPHLRLEGLRVLVVDDQRDTCEALQAILEAAGADVRARLSAAEALGELAVWRADVLVSDLGMPGEDGYAFIRSVRAGEAGEATPAVAVTGYVSGEDRLRALAAGFQRHVAKPVDAPALVSVVAELAGRS